MVWAVTAGFSNVGKSWLIFSMLTNVMCDLGGIHKTSGSVDKIWWRFIYEANKGKDYPAATTSRACRRFRTWRGCG